MLERLKDFKRSLVFLLIFSLLSVSINFETISAEEVKPTVSSNVSLATTFFKARDNTFTGFGYDSTRLKLEDGVWKYMQYDINRVGRWYDVNEYDTNTNLADDYAFGLYCKEDMFYSISFPDSESHWYSDYSKDNIQSVRIKNNLGEESVSLLSSDISSYLGIGSYKFSNLDILLSLMFTEHLSSTYPNYADLSTVTIDDEAIMLELENLSKSWLSDNDFNLEVRYNNGVVLTSELDMVDIPYVYDNNKLSGECDPSCVSFDVNYYSYTAEDSSPVYGSLGMTNTALLASVPTSKTISNSDFDDLLASNKKIAYVDKRDEDFSTLYVDIDSTDDLIIPLVDLSRSSEVTKFSFGDDDLYRQGSVSINTSSNFDISTKIDDSNIYKFTHDDSKDKSKNQDLGVYVKSDSEAIWGMIKKRESTLFPLEYNNAVYNSYAEVPRESIDAFDFLSNAKECSPTDVRYDLLGNKSSLPVKNNSGKFYWWDTCSLLGIKNIKDKNRVKDLLTDLVNNSDSTSTEIYGYSMNDFGSDWNYEIESIEGDVPYNVNKATLTTDALESKRIRDLIARGVYKIDDLDVSGAFKDNFTNSYGEIVDADDVWYGYEYRVFLPVNSESTNLLIEKMLNSNIGEGVYSQNDGDWDEGTYDSSCKWSTPSVSFDGYYIVKLNADPSASSAFVSAYNECFETDYASLVDISIATGGNLVTKKSNLSVIYGSKYKIFIDKSNADFLGVACGSKVDYMYFYSSNSGNLSSWGSTDRLSYYNYTNVSPINGYYVLVVRGFNTDFLNCYNNYFGTSFNSVDELSDYLNRQKIDSYNITIPLSSEGIDSYMNSDLKYSSFTTTDTDISIKVPVSTSLSFVMSDECNVVSDKLGDYLGDLNELNLSKSSTSYYSINAEDALLLSDIYDYYIPSEDGYINCSKSSGKCIAYYNNEVVVNDSYLDSILDDGLDYIRIRGVDPQRVYNLVQKVIMSDDSCIELDSERSFLPYLEFKNIQTDISYNKVNVENFDKDFPDYKGCLGLNASSISVENDLNTSASVTNKQVTIPNSELSNMEKGSSIDIFAQVRSIDKLRGSIIKNAVNASVADICYDASLESGLAVNNSLCLDNDNTYSGIKYIDYKFGNIIFASKPSEPLNLVLEDGKLTWVKPIDEGLGYTVNRRDLKSKTMSIRSISPSFTSKTDDIIHLDSYTLDIKDSSDNVVYSQTLTDNGSGLEEEVTIPATYLSSDYTAYVYATNKIGKSSSATINLGVPDGSVGIVTERDSYKVGDTITYTETITNSGSVDLNNVKVTQSLIDGDYEAQAGASFTDNVATITSLPVGSSMELKYKYVVPNSVNTGDTISNRVSITSDECISKDVTKNVTVVELNGSVGVVTERDSYKVGETITYTETITNNGTIDLTNVKVTQSLTGGTYDTVTGVTTTDNIATIPSLNQGDSVTLTYKYTVPTSANVGDTISNTVSITSDEGLNTDATKNVTVANVIKDLSLNVTTDKTSYKPGDTIVLNSSVKNTGEVDLTNVKITQQLDGEYIPKSGVTMTGKDAIIPTLAVGETVEVEYKIVIPSNYNQTSISNKTDVTADGGVSKNVVKTITVVLPKPTKAPTPVPTKAPTPVPTKAPTKAPTPVPEYDFTIKDVYHNDDGTTEVKERENVRIKEGEPYSFTALDSDDYIPRVPKYEGIATKDMEIIFEYDEKEKRVTIQGYVTYNDGTPIKDKLIELTGKETKTSKTDNTGFYKINNLLVGDYSYTLYNDVTTGSGILAKCSVSVTKKSGTIEVKYTSEDCKVDSSSEEGLLRVNANIKKDEPTPSPTLAPTAVPTPTAEPTVEPTVVPTQTPTEAPTVAPTEAPTVAPTIEPTVKPTEKPEPVPTKKPTSTPKPTNKPAVVPIKISTPEPTKKPVRVTYLAQTGIYDIKKVASAGVLILSGIGLVIIALRRRKK